MNGFKKWLSRGPQRAHLPPSQVSLLDRFPSPLFVGRTSALETDLKALLNALGYTVDLKLDKSHCISSCTQPATHQSQLESHLHPIAQQKAQKLSFYADEQAAKMVQKHYAADFKRFHFSTDPQRMWEVPEWEPRFDQRKGTLTYAMAISVGYMYFEESH